MLADASCTVHRMLLEGGIDAMFRVRRNQDVPADVDAGAGAFLERDDRQAD